MFIWVTSPAVIPSSTGSPDLLYKYKWWSEMQKYKNIFCNLKDFLILNFKNWEVIELKIDSEPLTVEQNSVLDTVCK